jgi:hypothetical protein
MEAIKSPFTLARNLRRIGIFSTAMLALPVMAANQPATEDQQALSEIAAAQGPVHAMYRILADEMRRIMSERPDRPSPEVAKILNSSATVTDLGDLHVPLHLRIIEQRRREMAAGIKMAQYTMAGHCENPQPRPEQLLDAAWRARGLQAIQCERDKMDRYQAGMHKINKEHEASLLALHLPPSTQEKMLAEARASTARQDADLESDYAKRRKSLQLSEEYLAFIDSHVARMHFTDGHIVFDDPADFKISQGFGERIKADLESQQEGRAQ